ncbi:MAG: AAA family ATPase [Phycisphaerales bacterium]
MAPDAFLPQQPIKELIEGFLAESQVMVFVGFGGEGKTLFMINAGVCVAGNHLFMGTRKTTQGNVLFVDEESGLSQFNLRLQKVINGIDGDPNIPFFYTSLSLFNLTTRNDLNELEKIIIDLSIKFVIIDAFMDVTPGADRNNSKDVSPVMQGLRDIAERHKCAIVVIHHNNKRGGYTGNTAIKDAADSLITIKKQLNVLTIKSEKFRYGEPFEFSAKLIFELDKIILSNAQKITFGAAQEFVIKFLAENGNSSMSDIKVHANGCKPDAARLAVMDLCKSLYVKRTDNGGPGTTGFYDLADEGNKVAAERNFFNDPWKIADYAPCSL